MHAHVPPLRTHAPCHTPTSQRMGSLAAHVLLWEPPLSKGPPSRQSCSIWEFKGQTPRLHAGARCRASPISQPLARQLRALRQLCVTQSLPLPHAAFLSPHRWSQGHSSVKLGGETISKPVFWGNGPETFFTPKREEMPGPQGLVMSANNDSEKRLAQGHKPAEEQESDSTCLNLDSFPFVHKTPTMFG